jgi:hypothetical protein
MITTRLLLNNGWESKQNEEAVTYFKAQSLHFPAKR